MVLFIAYEIVLVHSAVEIANQYTGPHEAGGSWRWVCFYLAQERVEIEDQSSYFMPEVINYKMITGLVLLSRFDANLEGISIIT